MFSGIDTNGFRILTPGYFPVNNFYAFMQDELSAKNIHVMS